MKCLSGLEGSRKGVLGVWLLISGNVRFAMYNGKMSTGSVLPIDCFSMFFDIESKRASNVSEVLIGPSSEFCNETILNIISYYFEFKPDVVKLRFVV